MKVKNDFITNSSSASFILTVKSYVNDLDSFKEIWDKYLDEYIDDNYYKFYIRVKAHRKWLRKCIKERKRYILKIENNTITAREKSLNDILYGDLDENYHENLLKLSNNEISKKLIEGFSIKHILDNIFEIESGTIMLNYLSDVPGFMKDLVLLSHINKEILNKLGFEEVSLKITDSHEPFYRRLLNED